jgi:hypothetical protein
VVADAVNRYYHLPIVALAGNLKRSYNNVIGVDTDTGRNGYYCEYEEPADNDGESGKEGELFRLADQGPAPPA